MRLMIKAPDLSQGRPLIPFSFLSGFTCENIIWTLDFRHCVNSNLGLNFVVFVHDHGPWSLIIIKPHLPASKTSDSGRLGE